MREPVRDTAAMIAGMAPILAEGRYVFDSSRLQTLFQEALLDNEQIDRYILRLTPASNTLNSLLLYGPDAEAERRPTAFITVTLSQ